MADVNNNNVKVLGIVLIVFSAIGIISALFDLSIFNEMTDLFNRFGVDTSSFAASQTILIILKFFIAISIIIFSVLFIRNKNIGRVGLILSLLTTTIYILFSPFLPSYEDLGPQPVPYDNSFEKMSFLYSYVFYIAISVGIYFIIKYLNKKETKQLFN